MRTSVTLPLLCLLSFFQLPFYICTGKCTTTKARPQPVTIDASEQEIGSVFFAVALCGFIWSFTDIICFKWKYHAKVYVMNFKLLIWEITPHIQTDAHQWCFFFCWCEKFSSAVAIENENEKSVKLKENKTRKAFISEMVFGGSILFDAVWKFGRADESILRCWCCCHCHQKLHFVFSFFFFCFEMAKSAKLTYQSR